MHWASGPKIGYQIFGTKLVLLEKLPSSKTEYTVLDPMILDFAYNTKSCAAFYTQGWYVFSIWSSRLPMEKRGPV